MKITSLKDAKDNFSRYVSACQKDQEPLLVTKGGRPAVLLVPVAEDSDVASLVLAWSPQFKRMLEESREQRRRGDSLSFGALKNELLDEEPGDRRQAKESAPGSKGRVRRTSSASAKAQGARPSSAKKKAAKVKSLRA